MLAKFLGLERREGSTLHVIGIVMLGISLFMLVAGLASALSNESLYPFLLPGIPGLVAGIMLVTLFRVSDTIRPVNGLFMLGSAWFVAIFLGTLPYLISGF